MTERGRRVPRPSLRLTVALLVAVVAAAPLLIVVGWLGVEHVAEGSMRNNARSSIEEAARRLARVPAAGSDPWTALAPVAKAHHVRLRVFDDHDAVLADHDFDQRRDLSERAGNVVLGRGASGGFERPGEPQPFSDIARLDEIRRRGESEGCVDRADSDVLVCYSAAVRATAAGTVVLYSEDSSTRLLSALYDLRQRLGRLTLVVLPFALALALWVGRRIVRPVEVLRARVLAKVAERRPRADLPAPVSSELADLATAFNTLLERLDARRAENEAFVADLVHEFKNPVAAIRVSADTLTAGGTDAARLERTARVLRDSSARLDSLVSQFLELARAEAGMTHEAWGAVDLAALCRAACERVATEEHVGEGRLVVNAPGTAVVWGVVDRLESVVDNLLANALSFAGEAGIVHVGVETQDENVLFTVKDEGPGIAESDLPHVFDRFFTTRRHDRGTGLGLALVRAVVEAHGGTVSVTSSPGRGAAFLATLPRHS